LAEDFHRSLGKLATEAVQDFFELDGRLWRTLPRLLLKPGQLTRDYVDGRRAFQIPPLRMFLVVLILLFFFGGLGAVTGKDAYRTVIVDPKGVHHVGQQMSKEDLEKSVNVDLGGDKRGTLAGKWLKGRIIAAVRNPKQYLAVVDEWGHRLAILMLPIGAGLLALLFVFKRRFFIFDHLIFTMHSLSFLGLLLGAYFLVKLAVPSVAGFLLLVPPVHLFVHMRGFYGSGVLGTLLRMALLFCGSMIGFGILMLSIFFIGLNAMSPA
jgi:hypothetical protein